MRAGSQGPRRTGSNLFKLKLFCFFKYKKIIMDYAKIIRERRPKLRDNSVTAYALSLKSMAPPDNKDLDYLYDTKEILQRLEKYKPNTRKNHLNAAVVVLQIDA